MSSVPHFYSNCTFPTDLPDFSTPSVAGDVTGGSFYGGPLWGQESLVPLFDNGLFDQIVSPQSDITSSVSMPPIPAQLGTSDLAMPTLLDCKMGSWGVGAGDENFDCGYAQQANMCEFGDECCGFLDDYNPVYPAAGENWGIQGNQPPAIEESSIKVGRYSEEERKERILRYLKKRTQRNFNKTIKYACRKTLADRRVRVRGRFARNRELCEEDRVVLKKNDDAHKEKDLCRTDNIQIKTDEDDWLQEAMASLMYLPYIAG